MLTEGSQELVTNCRYFEIEFSKIWKENPTKNLQSRDKNNSQQTPVNKLLNNTITVTWLKVFSC